MIRNDSRLFALLISSLFAVSSVGVLGQPETFSVPDPFEARQAQSGCPAGGAAGSPDLQALIDAMAAGAEQAMACVRVADELFPGWEDNQAAQNLVGPFVTFMLGDENARGLQRHEAIIRLLGPLQNIAPDWRLREEIDQQLSEVLLGSVVEDPFVSNFWRETLEEADLEWPDSEAAKSLVPRLYELALAEAGQPEERRNQRPRELLREISRFQYTRFFLATEVFDTWPKRIIWTLVTIMFLVLIVRRIRRRQAAKVRQ